MSDDASRDGDGLRFDELLRVNAELAAEVRRLSTGGSDMPRPGGMPTSRRLGRIIEERDALGVEAVEMRAELERSRVHCGELERRNAELAAEVGRLRGGLRGMLRRARARLFGS